MSNGLERLGRFSLAAIVAAPLVFVVFILMVISGLLSFAWIVRHPTRMMDDGYCDAFGNWLIDLPWVNRLANSWEGLVRKILKM